MGYKKYIIDLATDCPCKNALLDSYFTGLYNVACKIMSNAFYAKVNPFNLYNILIKYNIYIYI